MTAFLAVPLSSGLVALVDAGDYERVTAEGPWHARPHGRTTYAQRHMSRPGCTRTTQQMHTFITGIIGLDHRNGNGLDNRRSNLRRAAQSQNMANQRLRRTSTSGYRGVTARGQRWIAQIRVRGVQQHIGVYDTAEAAAHAYDDAATAAWGEFAHPNFSEETTPA
jgi:hypothetical protein